VPAVEVPLREVLIGVGPTDGATAPPPHARQIAVTSAVDSVIATDDHLPPGPCAVDCRPQLAPLLADDDTSQASLRLSCLLHCGVPLLPPMPRTAMIQQKKSWQPSSPQSRAPFRPLSWTSRLVVVVLIPSLSTRLLSCLHLRHPVSGKATARGSRIIAYVDGFACGGRAILRRRAFAK
jgi:hypothetical protein